jgi:hypothetical protein
VIIFVALLLGARVGGLLGVILAIPLIGVFKSIFEIVLDPTLPPQTGSFFFNPVKAGANLLDEAGVGTEDIEDKANQTTPSYSMSNEAES